MKAISIRQPWAGLIMAGKKTLELRNWKVKYRGPLAIHAAQTVEEAACRAFGVDPRQVSAGVLLGMVNLDVIMPLDETAFRERQAEHLSDGDFEAPLFGWRLSNPCPLDLPVPMAGRMGLFTVPDTLFEKKPAAVPLADEPASALHAPFELEVKAEPGGAYRLNLFQYPGASARQPALAPGLVEERRLVSELSGTVLKASADAVLEALRLNGYTATDLATGRRAPFYLTEESGVRLALIFMAVRPITRMARIEEMTRGIRSMTPEEMYYWFAKCTGGTAAERARRALRILLAGE
ncbi:MAG TPA: ASCH domain-containing protein [Anaerolineaceae bacterium]|nr:ASCH domain-containing protein [Anaerolineaceae bacterium]HPN54093.1 ASCH domain-containing protein [Anaerolineaceae bacterium]